jgi:hypothetical protein
MGEVMPGSENVMSDFFQMQNSYHQVLETYVNGALFSKRDVLLAFLSPRLPLLLHSASASKKFICLKTTPYPAPMESIAINIDPYGGNNPFVLKMMGFLRDNLADDVHGAYVHGSLGTYEEIPYSDFDALVILRDEILSCPRHLRRVAFRLGTARSIMYEFDPLQHHGWFVLTERDLECFPEHFFPIQLFRNSKSLLPGVGTKLRIGVRESRIEANRMFKSLGESLLRQLDRKHRPRNLYQLKSLLSRFMLLPALYIHARDGAGVFKRESFDLARVDFSTAEWGVMDEISEVRKTWEPQAAGRPPFPFSLHSALFRWLSKRYESGRPLERYGMCDEGTYQRMAVLIRRMIENVADKKISRRTTST